MTNSSRISEIINMLYKNNKKKALIRDLLLEDPGRFRHFSRKFQGILFDFSRCAVTEKDLSALLELAEVAGVSEARAALFAGEPINNSENRAVLHPLWRSLEFDTLLESEEAKECRQAHERMLAVARALHDGFLPFGPRDDSTRIRHIVHVGIGGSLLGPRLLSEAFPGGARTPAVHFISSVDAWERERLLASISPTETAIVLVSKSFTTSEVLAHARRLVQWQAAALDPDAATKRLFAVTSAAEKAAAFGVPSDHIMQMGEWTGGRFSLWSPVGLTAAVTMGPDAFERLCAGGEAMDRHFREAPPAENLPIIHGLLSCWQRNVQSRSCRGIIPYDGRLRGLPGWLQQVQMESNGKCVTQSGEPVTLATSPVVLGDCGTDAQHALFQAFHQGTEVVPLDFIGVIRPDHDDYAAQTELLSHLLAQASALAVGRDAEQTARMMEAEGKSPEQITALLPHRVMPGNRPSNVFMLDALTPENLGMLLVLYEHSVFVESVIWKINAFDQWGVELGKVMAGSIGPALSGTPGAGHGIPGLDGLVEYVKDRLN